MCNIQRNRAASELIMNSYRMRIKITRALKSIRANLAGGFFKDIPNLAPQICFLCRILLKSATANVAMIHLIAPRLPSIEISILMKKPKMHNTIKWAGVTQKFSAALNKLRAKRRTTLRTWEIICRAKPRISHNIWLCRTSCQAFPGCRILRPRLRKNLISILRLCGTTSSTCYSATLLSWRGYWASAPASNHSARGLLTRGGKWR